MRRTLGEIADHLETALTSESVRATPVSGLTLSSSSVLPGDLFIALSGAHNHGARFSDDARQRGAVAIVTDAAGKDVAAAAGLPLLVVNMSRTQLGILASWFYGDPSMALMVAGLTGTNGKTTTSFLLDAALRAGGHRTGLIGTVETRIGSRSVSSLRTTPEAPELQSLLAQMRDESISAVAMEVSSHALSLARVAGTHFAVSAFTNLSQDHLDFHGSMESYFEAKSMLFEPYYSASAVVCIDDEYGQRLAHQCTIPSLTLSVHGPADWSVERQESTTHGSTALVRAPDGAQLPVTVRLPGIYNLSNALVAIACAVNMGVSVEDAVAGVESCHGVPGRMERIDAGQDFVALVDYAHTPEAVASLLAVLRPLTSGRIIAVLGCGGDRDVTKRPLMGSALARGSDLAILTSDNPRSENPQQILDAMETGARSVENAQILVEQDRRTAIRVAISEAQPGDIVVVAGKGHEQGQEIAGVVTAFDDRDEVRHAIAELAAG